MKRSTFIKNSIIATAGATLIPHLNFANNSPLPDLVIARGNNLKQIYNLAIKAIGGLEQFDFSRKKILIKPTLNWDKTELHKQNSHPALIHRSIRSCYDAEASEVYVLSNTIDNWSKTYRNSGIEKATKEAFGKMIPATDAYYYQEEPINGFHFHQMVYYCDYIINMPKLNINGTELYSGALLNLNGLTLENGIGKNQKLIESTQKLIDCCQPVLHILEVTTLEENDDYYLVAGKDPVAVDAMGCQLRGIAPNRIGVLNEAEQAGLGTLQTSKLQIQKIYA